MATFYRIRFNNVEGQAVECTLTDQTTDLDIIEIEGAEDAVHIVSQDNDESKYSPIKAKKCVIKFLNSPTVNIRTFATGEDDRFLVEVKINSLRVFVGHLEQGDIEEPFQYEDNEIVTLTATDGLGSLKNHRMEDVFAVWSNPGPSENRIIDYIASCLASTKLSLPINVINNLREEDNPVTDTDTFGNIYAALYLNIKTWEDQKVDRLLHCYDVLERILGHDCFLTQAKGEWWIIRVRELRPDFNEYVTRFDFNGDIISITTHNYNKAIGLKDVNNTPFAGDPDATAFFSQDKTVVSLQRPVKSVTLRFNYVNPIEILCNEDFNRGDFIADLPDEVDGDGFTRQVKSYDFQCWEYDKNVPPGTQDSTAYVKKYYQFGQEKERFVHMEQTAVNGFYYLMSTERIPVGLQDKFTLSFAVRYSTTGATGHFKLKQAWVRLYGDDGTFWNLHSMFGTGSQDPNTYWRQSDGPPNWATNQTFCFWEGEGQQTNFTQWANLTFNADSVPRSGRLEILLLNDETPSAQTKDFGSLNFEYNPYVNGNYDTFRSQVDVSTQDGIYINTIEDEVFIGNAPRQIFKGALLKKDGANFIPVGRFYEGQEYPTEAEGLTHLATYGLLRVAAYHNQYRNANEIYRMTNQGLTEGQVDGDGYDDHQDIIHRYFNRDIEPATNTKAFQLVNQDVDLRNCEWTGTMIENFSTSIGFVTDTYDFHYETPDDLGETTTHGEIPGEEPGPIIGDDIEAAIELVGETWTVTGNNSLATTQAVDNSEDTIWYRWTAPLDGMVNINTSGSNFNTTIRVGTWDGVTFTEIDYNDDATGSGSDLSSLDFLATVGIEYYFSIGGPTTADIGNYVFNMDLDTSFEESGSGSGGADGTGGRFGIEDVLGEQNREVDMQGYYLYLNNISEFYVNTGFIGLDVYEFGSQLGGTNSGFESHDDNYPTYPDQNLSFIWAQSDDGSLGYYIYAKEDGIHLIKNIISGQLPLDEYADNAAALAAGRTVGFVYRTGDNLKIVH